MLRKLHIPAFAFLIAAGLGTGITGLVHRHEVTSATEKLERELTDVADLVSERVNQVSTVLMATRSYLGTRTAADLPRDRFARYVESLAHAGSIDGIHGLGLAEIISDATEAQMLERLRRDYGPERVFWPTERAPGLHTAIMLLEPADARNLAAIGYDMYSEPMRQAAMRASMDSGQPIISGPVKLVQEITADQQVGALIYLFMDGTEGSAQPGFVYAPVRMGRLFESIGLGGASPVAIRVVDASFPDPVLYQSATFAELEDADTILSTVETTIAGRKWQFSGRRNDASGLFSRWPLTMIVGAVSLLLSALIALAVQGFAASIRHNREFAQAQQRSLQEKDLHLREMSHRLKNALARVVAMTRQAGRQADSKEAFVTSMTQRLQSMAQAQDLLIRSATEGADLYTLVSVELKQIYGDADAGVTLDGPDIRLNATQTQALGLTVHELATNALKYGAGAAPGGHLAITWRVQRIGRTQMLRLVWAETTVDTITEPERKGFGSQLIDSCIRLELGGTIERKFGSQGLTVTITVPFDQPAPRNRKP